MITINIRILPSQVNTFDKTRMSARLKKSGVIWIPGPIPYTRRSSLLITINSPWKSSSPLGRVTLEIIFDAELRECGSAIQPTLACIHTQTWTKRSTRISATASPSHKTVFVCYCLELVLNYCKCFFRRPYMFIVGLVGLGFSLVGDRWLVVGWEFVHFAKEGRNMISPSSRTRRSEPRRRRSRGQRRRSRGKTVSSRFPCRAKEK